MVDYLEEAKTIEDDLIRWRRDFHRNPELGYEEVRTAGIVAKHLRDLGFAVKTGVGKTGVVGLLRGKNEGPVALIRFDMDALPIQEENEVEYKSQVAGVMHACGHDSHTAMGMGVAKLLAQHDDKFSGTVKLVFQPAEEGGNGALAMIEDGVLENPRPDFTFGLHIDSQTPLGIVKIGDGYILTAADIFQIAVNGSGGHGALPHETVDAVVVAAQIVNMLQTIVSRNIDPLELAIISIGSIHAGDAFNVIADKAEITGTVRTYNEEIRTNVHRRMREIITSTAQALGATAELNIEEIASAAFNDPEICAQTRELAIPIFGEENISKDQRATPADDIAEFLKAAPGCHFYLGAMPDGKAYPHHNPRFDINEKAMPLGVALLCREAIHFLAL